VQCGAPGCGKWRRLPGWVDAGGLPQDWTCGAAYWAPGWGGCGEPEEAAEEEESAPWEGEGEGEGGGGGGGGMSEGGGGEEGGTRPPSRSEMRQRQPAPGLEGEGRRGARALPPRAGAGPAPPAGDADAALLDGGGAEAGSKR
jgi:hypothetical protein